MAWIAGVATADRGVLGKPVEQVVGPAEGRLTEFASLIGFRGGRSGLADQSRDSNSPHTDRTHIGELGKGEAAVEVVDLMRAQLGQLTLLVAKRKFKRRAE